jgi:large subunit ribosomal protein L28
MNKSRRRFLPNLQASSLVSEALDRIIKLRLAASTLRSIEKRGGLDSYLLSAKDGDLTLEAVKIKRKIKTALAKA